MIKTEVYFCKKCNKNQVYWTRYLYGTGICGSCAQKIRCNRPEEIERRSKLMSGKNNPNYKDGRCINPECIDCGKEISRHGVRCKSCSAKGVNNSNYGKTWMLGENNPAWKGGKSKEDYPLEFNYKLKEMIRIRDNYTCQECGKKQEDNDRALDVHHKDEDKTNLNSSNLISFCRSCHNKKR